MLLPDHGSLALVSDIHGHALALEAVADDIGRRGTDAAVCLGDIAATGPRPHEVVSRLRSLGWPALTGNTDAWLLDPQPPPADADAFLHAVHDADAWCAQRLDKDDRAYLRGLPRTLNIALGANHALLCFHGSPRSFHELLLATTPAEILDEAFEGIEARLWAGGHSHQPLLRRHGDALLLNPGSAGIPYQRMEEGRLTRTPPWAEYAELRWTPASIQVTFRQVPLESADVVEDMRASGMPHVDTFTAGRRR